jgi:hypothetical protein
MRRDPSDSNLNPGKLRLEYYVESNGAWQPGLLPNAL